MKDQEKKHSPKRPFFLFSLDRTRHPLWLLFVYITLFTWTVWNLLKNWN